MIKNILIIILGYSNFVIGQSELSITPYFCQSWGDISNYDHEIEVYKEGDLIAKEFYAVNDFTARNLKKGKYLIKYKTIFNQELQMKIDLNKSKTSIEICIDDYIKIKERTFVEDLKNNDTLEIWAYGTGCEYIDFGKIQLTRKGPNIEATLINDDQVNHRILSKEDLKLIEEIEHKIQLIKANEEDGFLRTYHYEIRLNGTEKIVTKFGIQAIGYALKMKEIFNK